MKYLILITNFSNNVYIVIIIATSSVLGFIKRAMREMFNPLCSKTIFIFLVKFVTKFMSPILGFHIVT